jgi:hypothetical protein
MLSTFFIDFGDTVAKSSPRNDENPKEKGIKASRSCIYNRMATAEIHYNRYLV